jgi:putative ABC transport system substrate-binding protein
VFLGLAASADDPGAGEILRPFKAAMQEAGWIDGKNVRLDYRFGGGEIAKINAAAAELVALAPELIYATGLPPVQALRQRTRTIPIVFSLVADPVGVGLIESLSHPGDEGLEPLLATLVEKVIAPAEGKVKDLENRRRRFEVELTKPR